MRLLCLAAILCVAPLGVAAACGGTFSDFKDGLRDEAIALGIGPETAQTFLRGVHQDRAVLRADKAQGVFQRPFVDFSRRLISADRLRRGKSQGQKFEAVFDRIEQEYGISRGVLLAFWAFETDFGTFQGDFNTANALVTLAHDCRRPDLFRPQIFAAMELFARGDFDPAKTTGAWAGEIGMVQMLPRDILENGTDGDGDGQVSLTTSAPDALMSAARMLHGFGWQARQPWITEVSVPEGFDWSLSGLETTKPGAEWAALGVSARNDNIAADLPASLIVPQGRYGPAFLTYPNFRVYFDWNQSFTYVLTAAYFATRLEGAQIYNAGNPDVGLTSKQMKQLQTRLRARGHDVGEVDGILGAGTRAAVRSEQTRLGMPPDAWPTPGLLDQL